MKKVFKNLENLGLSEIEIKVYLEIIDSLEISAYEIGKNLSIPRATVYKVLERLKKKEIIIESRKNNVKHYHAETFNVLKRNAEEKLLIAEQTVDILRKRSISSGSKKPITRMYTNKKGLQKVWSDMMEEYKRKPKSHIYVLTNIGLFNNIPGVIENIKYRRKLGIVANIIYPISQRMNIDHIKKDGNDRFKFIDDHFSYPGEVTVYGHNVAMFLFNKQKPLAVIIESKEMAEMVENLLKFLWHNTSY